MLDVGQGKVAHVLSQQLIAVTPRQSRAQNATFAKTVPVGYMAGGSRQKIPKQSEVRLYLCGLYARMPMVCIPLTSRHCMVRKSWANEHRD